MDAGTPRSSTTAAPAAPGTFPGAAPQRAERDWTSALQASDGRFIHAARLAALGELATGIAHEMNQPLAAIQMIVTSMLIDLDGGELPPERAREWLGTVNEQVVRMAWMIGHLRSFAGNDEPEPLACAALGEAVENALGLLRAQMRSHGIRVEVEVGKGLPEVRGDVRRFEQVLVNLLSNARDAVGTLPAGAPRTVRVRARAGAEGNLVVLEVADTGPGIAAEVRERMFEPFFTTKGAGKGTGLGLSIVHRIVADCGGRIAVETGPGAGTTFRIELPAARPAGAKGAEGVEPGPGPGRQGVEP